MSEALDGTTGYESIKERPRAGGKRFATRRNPPDECQQVDSLGRRICSLAKRVATWRKTNGLQAKALLAEKAYDSEKIVQSAQAQGMHVIIPCSQPQKAACLGPTTLQGTQPG